MTDKPGGTTDKSDGAMALYTTMLDAYADMIRLSCKIWRFGFVMRGHADGIDAMGAMSEGAHLTGPSSGQLLDERAAAMLARYERGTKEPGPMPGLAEADQRTGSEL